MRFMNWLRSLRKEKPVVQPTPFKGVDMTPDRRGVLPERVQVPLKNVPDPGESLRLARRPSQAQAEQMRRDALADQERIKDMRARHREREDEAYLRRIQQLNYSTYYKRSRAIGSNSAKDNDDDNTVGGAIAGVAVGLAMVDMITNAGSANACTAPSPAPFVSGGGGDFGGAGAGGSWKETAPAPYYGSSSDDSSGD